MTVSRYLRTTLVLAIAGTAFAGYLSGVKFFSETCAFGESCPYFLGYPACYYGLAMYLAMLGATAAALAGKLEAAKAVRTNAVVSFLGILFAGYFVLQEVAVWAGGGAPRYSLGLPTCAYGLIFYAVIFGLSLAALRTAFPKPAAPPPRPPAA